MKSIGVLEQYALGRVPSTAVWADPEFQGLVAIIKKLTLRWGTKMGYYTTRKYSPEIQKWIDFFRVHSFEGNRTDIIALVGELTGLDLKSVQKSMDDKVLFEWGVIVVPLVSGEHSYAIGDPVLQYRRDDQFLRSSGSLGDRMTKKRDCVRPATADEVDGYFQNCLDNMNGDTFYTIMNTIALQLGI